MVICLECSANDLCMVQLMPLSLSHLVSLTSEMVYLISASLPRLSWKVFVYEPVYKFSFSMKFAQYRIKPEIMCLL